MNLKQRLLFSPVVALATLFCLPASGSAQSILLSAGDFTALGGTFISSTGTVGTTIRNGNIGLSPGATSGITGFPPAVIINGAIVATGAVTGQARLDLITPIAKLVAAIPELLPKDARARLLNRTGVTTMADRDRAVEALQGICDLALALDEIRARLQDERYGDARYEEAQLGLRVLDDVLAPAREDVAAFTRSLSGTVG